MHHRTPPHDPLHGHIPASRVLSFVDETRLDHLLEPLVPDAHDRKFVLRCLIGEGPLHHRGANYLLLALLGKALEAHGASPAPAAADGVAVPMRLPPHLREQVEAGHYPLTLPTAALGTLAGGDAVQLHAMVDCLTDGPPQHALANAVMVALLESLVRPA